MTAPVARPDRFPPCTVGKLFTARGALVEYGTGWVIGESAVMTAAHCLFAHPGGWPDRLLFIPRYGSGTDLPQWRGVRFATVVGWAGDADWAYDLAAFLTDRPVAPLAGRLGWRSDPSVPASVTALGYPVVGALEDRMYQSTGRVFSQAAGLSPYNDMTAGSSGGPWIVEDAGAFYAKGLNSFRQGDGQMTYSPYFAEAFRNLEAWGRG